jgi:hypothetical protein
VVGADRVLAEALAQMARRPLGHPAGVDEDQGRAVHQDQLGDAAVDLLPLVVRHHRAERRRRDLEREVALLRIADVDDPAIGIGRADQEARDLVDRLLGRRHADAGQRLRTDRLQPLERQREMAAALAGGEGMDLVDDHGARGREQAPARQRAEQHVQRFGGRHQHVRRLAQRLLAFARRRVAGSHGGADLDIGKAGRRELGADAGERRLEVQADVVRQRLQWRHVDHRGLVGQAAGFEPPPHQAVERGEKRGQRLARTGRCGDQRVAAGMDRRPGRDLRGSRRRERAAEPGRDGRMEVFEEHGRAGRPTDPLTSGRGRGCQGLKGVSRRHCSGRRRSSRSSPVPPWRRLR